MMIENIVLHETSEVKRFISNNFADELHKKRQKSLADGVIGVLSSGSLQPSAMGC